MASGGLPNAAGYRLGWGLRTRTPWLDASDEPVLLGWCELEVLAAAVFNELMARGVVNERGEPRRLLAEYRQLRQTELRYAEALGFSPAARTSLQVGDSRARAFDLTAQ